MADRATGGAGKPPLYKIVMLGDSGVGKTSLGECGLNLASRCYRLRAELAFLLHEEIPLLLVDSHRIISSFILRSRSSHKPRQTSKS